MLFVSYKPEGIFVVSIDYNLQIKLQSHINNIILSAK